MLSLNRQAIALISDHADPAAEIGSEEAGGQNVYVRHVGETLASLGWHVDMFTRKVNADDEDIVQHTPHCRTIRLQAGAETYIPRDQLFGHMPEFVSSFQSFQRTQGLNYPLVHTNYWLSAWAGMELQKTSAIQLVHTYHSLGAVKYQDRAKTPQIANTRLKIEREILERANCVVATSPQEQETLRSLVSTQGQIEVIPCGTDTNNFRLTSKALARAKLKFGSQEKIILYVGRFDERKGIETLVRAFALLKEYDLPHLKLVIVGGSSANMPDGDERERIEHIVDELGLRDSTVFTGRIGHDILPFYYTAADVCVIPSHYEPFGLVAIEAMACGVPVVASNVGGLTFTILPEETGLLVPPKDVVAFANGIHRILFDELWVRKMRKQASANVNQRFSWTGVTIQLSELYRHVLARSIMHEQAWNYKMPSITRSA
ncbi:glycosyltransferase family 1 protein [Pseudanabaena sp. FACHB-1998]|uniref:glycosyltransferase family 4 protein n=1 Tax=Pseudanabaena sp. FACHB-1998 TaxID=2692858 RepID=UPI001680C251|nr:glycosyltransferase family 1 protein [Pseudanabaena sp. FACHB-1998]MBD2178640.1 glycosyltransferase family 1 protein [Pseudanabaena sp. FACHB-1998]